MLLCHHSLAFLSFFQRSHHAYPPLSIVQPRPQFSPCRSSCTVMRACSCTPSASPGLGHRPFVLNDPPPYVCLPRAALPTPMLHEHMSMSMPTDHNVCMHAHTHLLALVQPCLCVLAQSCPWALLHCVCNMWARPMTIMISGYNLYEQA